MRKSSIRKAIPQPRVGQRSEPLVADADDTLPLNDDDDRQQSVPSNGDIENRIASTEVLNPDDALNLLAQVADRDAAREAGQYGNHNSVDGVIVDYPPITEGLLSKSEALQLLDQYDHMQARTVPS